MTMSDREKLRIDRLAELGRLWGVVKFFHPYLAYKDIDWDAALISTIPKVRGGGSVEEYVSAINDMLGALQDNVTRATLRGAALQAQPSASIRVQRASGTIAYYQVVDDVLILNCPHLAEKLARDGAAGVNRVMPTQPEIRKAKGIIFDCRISSGSAPPSTWPHANDLDRFLRRTVVPLLDRPVVLGTYRHREHSGYPPQVGTTSGGYSSAVVAVAPDTLNGNRRGELPMAFVVNGSTPDIRLLLSGLQAARRATIIRESSPTAADYSSTTTHTIELADGIAVAVRTREFVGPRGESDLQADTEVPAAGPGTADFALEAALKSLGLPPQVPLRAVQALPTGMRGHRDSPYPNMSFPNAEYRLLALFRLWNVIQYFLPYKDLMDESWPAAHTEFIPRMEASTDQLDYEMTLATLVRRLNDSHGGLWGSARALTRHIGEFAPPLTVRSLGNQTVITSLHDDAVASSKGIAPGDIVLAIDGELIEQRRTRLSGLVSASTPQALRGAVDALLLRGPRDRAAVLRIMGSDDQSRVVEVPRTVSWRAASPAARTVPKTTEVLPSGYGYIDLSRLKYEDADSAIDQMVDQPAIIFDMRGYPNGTAWIIAPRLAKDDKTRVGAIFRRPYWSGATLALEDFRNDPSFQENVSFVQPLPRTDKTRYRGRVVMLIDETTQSQAEHTCLFFAAATDVTFIGQPTAGADGDVTNLVLPGNLVVTFTGHDVRHPDGRQLQRIGIQPHIRVEPTIAEIRQRRDAILEAAVKYLQDSLR